MPIQDIDERPENSGLLEEPYTSSISSFEQIKTLRSLAHSQSFVPEGNMKERVRTLENCVLQQHERNDQVSQTLEMMEADTVHMDNNLRSYISQTSHTLDSELKLMKQEIGHRFELQEAENKRLQQHVATLKAENHQLQRKLQIAEARLKGLEVEVRGEADASTAIPETPSIAAGQTHSNRAQTVP